ncbi:MAG: GNAT family N-acetyltransferase [Ruminococcaceae bacterium]|nr:GNAT family N-acetyltransferase [Oscillospiraceae bacterium]
MKFEKISPSEFPFIYKEMEKSFIKEEIRDFDDAVKVLENPDYSVYHIEYDGKKVGFITVWKLSEYYFIEHFAVYEKYRNMGFGKTAIGLFCQKHKKVFLEAEPPHTDLASRRINFYKRCGFCINDFKYMQPSYRKNGDGIELVILSFGEVLPCHKKTIKELYKAVYGVL